MAPNTPRAQRIFLPCKSRTARSYHFLVRAEDAVGNGNTNIVELVATPVALKLELKISARNAVSIVQRRNWPLVEGRLTGTECQILEIPL